MLQPRPAPDAPLAEWLRSGAGRRALAIALALLIEGLLLLILLTLSAVQRPEPEKEEVVTVANLEPVEAAEETPDPGDPEPADRPTEQPLPRPTPQEPRSLQPSESPPAQPAQPSPVPTPAIILPSPFILPPSSPAPRTATRPPSTGRVYGPPDVGGSPALRDTAVVGTAPNGEPLYAAAWHREPRDSELRDYLSTARGPGWGLIACRTAPNYRVVDCVALDEYPNGSQINRAILAAAWEFQVRPPRRGGRLLVGSWVRIRIDYRVGRP